MSEPTTYRSLILANSQERGAVLLGIIRDLDDEDEIRRLITENWTVCEAWGDDLGEILEIIERVGWVGDELPEDSGDEILTIYRATGGEEPDGGSWTLDLEVAKKFALSIASPRAAFLGYYSETPVVWEANVWTSSVLGYFDNRAEAEVIIPNDVLLQVGPILKLGKADG